MIMSFVENLNQEMKQYLHDIKATIMYVSFTSKYKTDMCIIGVFELPRALKCIYME